MHPAAIEEYAVGTLVEVPQDMDVVDSCGDNREPTRESANRIAELLETDVLPMEKGFASIFGGPVGKAISVLAVGIAIAETTEEKRQFLSDIGGIDGTLGLIREVRSNRSVLHSDTSKEGNSLHFDTTADKADEEVGCLYNGSLGKVLDTISNNPAVRRAILEDLYRTFGDDTDKESRQLLDAFGFLLGELAAGRDHTFGRADYKAQERAGIGVVVLAGKHPTVLESGLLVNFTMDTVGNPTKAHENGLDPYRSDLGRIALGMSDLLAEHNMSARLFLKATLVLGTAVRGALVAADSDSRLHGMIDPSYLPLGIVGDANSAASFIDAKISKPRTTVL
jgi:hypothetical protein